ncbi:MAG: thioredoxin [Fibrobacteria bacterium]|nr:thioredoxin [Fibrobacteria bacterium]
MASENVLTLNDSNFDETIKDAEVILVDFWAPWCGPCRMIGPIVEEIAGDYAGKIKVGKVNTDESPNVSTTFGIRSIPTLIIFKNGQVVEQIVGAVSKDSITAKIDNQLA